MAPRKPPSPSALSSLSSLDSSLDLALILSSLSSSNELLSDELTSLGAIYDSSTPALSLYSPPSSPPWSPTSTTHPLLLSLLTTLPSADETPLHLVLSLPTNTYPTTSPPLIQLSQQYIDSYSVTDELFGRVLRCFMHDASSVGVGGGEGGIEWVGEPCLYEGVEWVRTICEDWVQERRKETVAKKEREEAVLKGRGVYGVGFGGEVEREEEEEEGEEGKEREGEKPAWMRKKEEAKEREEREASCPKIVSSEALVDRKSVFIGHAARVTSMDDVSAVMDALLSDKKIARATHNITAFRFLNPSGTLNQDNDDDGESAAGSRLAHLLSLLDVQNVLVVVTRWYGGIHLGADRFKDINHVARDALTLGGFLDEQPTTTNGDKKGGKGGSSGKTSSKKR